MCGIVGVVAERDVAPLLLDGLQRLEYRGYDSAGLVVRSRNDTLQRLRRAGPVRELAEAMRANPITGATGIAHTRWATHGAPTEANAHPQVSGERVALVHNGIIENADMLRRSLRSEGYEFTSQTDTEVIAHLINKSCRNGGNAEAAVLAGVRHALAQLEGQFALVIMLSMLPGRLIAARRGCPLIIGRGVGENFIASDAAALVSWSRELVDLADGDVAILGAARLKIQDADGKVVRRRSRITNLEANAVSLNGYRHFMQKEIFEQPDAIRRSLHGRVSPEGLLDTAFDPGMAQLLAATRAVHFVACGTSYHAALLARYMTERLAGIPCIAEQASEYRYRNPVVTPGTLLITISQSGETADTLAALRMAREGGHGKYCGTLTVCNVPDSALARESDAAFMTDAGPEIGVASTKAFTTQLVALTCIAMGLARLHAPQSFDETAMAGELARLPQLMSQVLSLEKEVRDVAAFVAMHAHTLFIARGMQFPIALEAALKLKEISYIHADAYPAGELKHGPLALVDHEMPVIALAPVDPLHEKTRSNIQEVAARGGRLIVLSDTDMTLDEMEGTRLIGIPRRASSLLDPWIYTVPLQLLAYHAAVALGTDVDKPRNLAKSVTVE